MPTGRIYLDANVFIAMLERNDELSGQLLGLFAIQPKAEEPWLVTSELTLAETIVAPIREENAEELASYERTLSTSDVLEVAAVDRQILRRAGELRAFDIMFRLPDAIHVATAQLSGCERFLTADKRLTAALGRPSPFFPLVPMEPSTEALAALLTELRP